ncbi:MAG: sulfurtransferase [Candidatus Dormibacteraeota bacterium]|nr:sulfurtransferase [Candidatus Dormibacteraeota bacterium]
MSTFGPLVSAAWLQEHLADPDLRVIDFRWYQDGRSGRDAHRTGHVPGAAFVDLEGDVTGPRPGLGRHPLPEREAFERVMRVAGVGRDSRVVVYDDQSGLSAGRLWWMLRYFGHTAVAVLDGGLAAWPGELVSGEEVVPAGDFAAAEPVAGWRLDFEDVTALGDGTVLLDARSAARYRGEPHPLDVRPGHIPGARSAPWDANLGPDGRFLPPDELRRRFRELGVERGTEAVVYCGSGVSACHDLLALELAGLSGARLYPGSWSDWTAREGTPAETADPS